MRNRSGSFNAGANRPAASAPVAIPARNAGAATPSDGSASDAASTFPSPVRRIAAALQARLSPLARLGSLGLPRPQAHGLFRGNTVHPAPDAESSLSPRMDQPDDIESIGMFALDDVTPIMPLNDSLDAISSSLENWVDSASSDEQASARKRASVRIRLAAQQGSPRLDLSRCELDSLPNCLHMLGALRALAVNNNRMTVLPSRMPPRLAHLSARSNQLVRLPASLPDTITMLIVGNNKITGLHLASLPTCGPYVQRATRSIAYRRHCHQRWKPYRWRTTACRWCPLNGRPVSAMFFSMRTRSAIFRLP